MQKYMLVVRDKIILPRPCTDEDLKCLDCYYESPVFSANGSISSFQDAIERYYTHFKHFFDWTAELVAVE